MNYSSLIGSLVSDEELEEMYEQVNKIVSERVQNI